MTLTSLYPLKGHDTYLQPLHLAPHYPRLDWLLDQFWAEPRLQPVNLGCGNDVRKGWLNVDAYPNSDPGVKRLDFLDVPWPIPSASTDRVLASQVMEHLPPHAHNGRDAALMFLSESARILIPGGRMVVAVPDANGRYAWSNITHYRGFDERTIDSALDGVEPHSNHNQTGVIPLRRVGTLKQRVLTVTKWFDSSYHGPKYLGFAPNIGRRRYLFFLLEKPGRHK